MTFDVLCPSDAGTITAGGGKAFPTLERDVAHLIGGPSWPRVGPINPAGTA
jgi:hypothetical protein